MHAHEFVEEDAKGWRHRHQKQAGQQLADELGR